jgi:hypothetical protein
MIRLITFFVAVLGLCSNSFAEDWQNPEAKFEATKNLVNISRIKWVHVSNVQNTCESESRKRKLGGFGYPVEACSFWVGNECTIFTGKKTTLHSLGHEVRHCFQGQYH